MSSGEGIQFNVAGNGQFRGRGRGGRNGGRGGNRPPRVQNAQGDAPQPTTIADFLPSEGAAAPVDGAEAAPADGGDN